MSWSRSVRFADRVRAGDVIVWSHGGAEPTSLMTQLMDQRHSFGGPVTVFLTGVSFSTTVSPGHADAVRFVSIGGLGSHRRFAQAGCLDVLPCRYAELPGMIRDGVVGVDVAMVLGTAPNADGLVSLGPTVAVSREVLGAARVRYLEINPNVPFVGGDALVPIDGFDEVIESDGALVTLPQVSRRPSATTERICEHIAGLVRDGATIQLGIGSIGLSLPRLLADRRDLGIHSAILTDPLAELIESGVANGKNKVRDVGLAVAGELCGSADLYRYVDHNDSVALRTSASLLDPHVLGELDDLVSVNSALQVDLTGQVNAETLNGVHVGAVGGQVDFVRAASRAPHGVSIIALPSTAGPRSRIVPRLDDGIVTTARSDVDAVITEFGMARLRGLPAGARVEALAAIAHPDHRRELLARVGR